MNISVAFSSVLSLGFISAGALGASSLPTPADYVPIDAIQIQDKFSVLPIDKNNLQREVLRCVPTFPRNGASLQDVERDFPSHSVNLLGHVSSANFFLLQRRQAICVQRASSGFPIYSAQAFEGTVSPEGPPAAVIRDWYRKVAAALAKKGKVTVAYSFGNGAAYAAEYFFAGPLDPRLRYSSKFKKAGTWDAQSFDLVFRHPDLASVSTVAHNGALAKDFPVD
ncbi:MAG TPA: hypothetical protein VLC08_07415 [Chitinolyticbacter sp.]|nr:hypothetical protein [Chitinolyticbacter sp.]